MIRRMILASLCMLGVVAVLLSGCGFLTQNVGDPPDPCQSLHALDFSMAPDPVFNADEQPRQQEVCQRVAQDYKDQGYQVTFSSRGPSGTTYDWVAASSVQGSDAEPPPTYTPEQIQAMLPPGVQLQLTEIDVNPDLSPQASGLIPFVRPTYSAYVAGDTGATSLDDWIQNFQVVGAPPDAGSTKPTYRLYAGQVTFAPNFGGSVWINAYTGDIEEETLSLQEMVVGCRDPNNPISGELRQMVGIAASRDKLNLKRKFDPIQPDSLLRLQVEFLTVGSGSGAIRGSKGGWAGFQFGFIPAGFRPYGPGTPFPPSGISTVGGPQFESFYQIAIKDGDWWVGHNGNWLGRYPHALFDAAPPVNAASPSNLIASQACELDIYGEVALRAFLSSPWTKTPMGSGQYASAGWSHAANFRNPAYAVDANNPAMSRVWTDSDPNVKTLDAQPYNPLCYSKTLLTSGPTPADRFFYVSGPGGSSPSCQYP